MLRHKRLVGSNNNTSSSKRGAEREHDLLGRRLLNEKQRQGSSNNHHEGYDDDDDDNEDLRWSQAARFCSDDLLEQFEEESSRERRQKREARKDRVATGGSGGGYQPFASTPSPQRQATRDTLDDDADDNSSISFAQSGCHSILSAWRIKAANRAARSRNPRPQSVLSNGSSTGKKSAASTVFTLRGKSPASQTRIALGPRAAQHFVTNSRRRRQANELILTTLEARRRALQLNRQNASLFGSASYLAGAVDDQTGEPLVVRVADELSNRLSLSPSPVSGARRSKTPPSRGRTPSPGARSAARPAGALSDLGGRVSASPSAAAQAQRQRLLLNSAKTASKQKQQASASIRSGRPPLAKLDQNSSDLYSSNSSSGSDSSSSSSSSSSGSQFTQLVTSELTPDCVMLEQQVAALNQHAAASARRHQSSPQHNIVTRLVSVPSSADHKRVVHNLPPPVRPKPRFITSVPAATSEQAPKVPERTRKKQQQLQRSISVERRKGDDDNEAERDEDDGDQVSNLRRGALRRDSIRKLRLNRGGSQNTESSSSDVAPSSSESSSFQATTTNRQQQPQQYQQQQPVAMQQQPLPKSRRLDIESNPFLNRGHFRSSVNSVRSGAESVQPAKTEQRHQQTQEQPRQQQAAAKRNSWLFGSRNKAPAATPVNEEQPPTRTRSFSENRVRSSSSEFIRAGSSCNKLSKQQSQSGVQNETDDVDAAADEGIKRVEGLLRSMRPNQVFTSYARESMKSQSMAVTHQSTATSAGGGRMSPQMVSQRHSLTSATSGGGWQRTSPSAARTTSVPSMDAISRTNNIISSSKTLRTQSSSKSIEREESRREKTVREASKSYDDLKSKFDEPTGTSDKSNHKQQGAMQPERWRHEKSAEQERLEMIRSPSISPPLGFADSVASRQQQVAAKPAPAARLKRTSQPPEAPSVARVPEAKELPKFERTADDEFRKRVDYLRKLARSNLSGSPAVTDSQERRSLPPPATTTKPMSTNWRPDDDVKMIEDGDGDDRLKPVGRKPAETLTGARRAGSSPQPPAAITTNLDALLIADRYQSPLSNPSSGPTFASWRRSNSSLAAVGRSTRSPASSTIEAARPAGATANVRDPSRAAVTGSPVARMPALSGNEQVQMSSTRVAPTMSAPMSSQQPSASGSSAAVKLVVKEKSAPKLDYAFVEQQPMVQHARPAVATSQQQSPRQPQQMASTPIKPSEQQALRARTRSPLRVASPRSPDFGPTAASSNDDSAIASSVSSPSLSFMMNPQAAQAAGAELPTGNRPQRVPVTLSGASHPHPQQQQQAPGALQSILRRQQLQHQYQLQASAESSSESDPTSHLQTAGSGGQSSSVKRALGQSAPTTSNHQEAPVYRLSPEPAAEQRPLSPSLRQSNQQSQQQPTPPKRVHFNDRTSIRSFESVSSLASNSTAVPNEQLRQQVGSPDSMGSGSTSRLSAESPDESRRGAAIYAVRGDPELELDHQQRPSAVGQPRLQQQIPYSLQQHQPPAPIRYATAVPTTAYHQGAAPGHLSAAPVHQQQRGPFLRMNAPASIVSSPVQYIARPTSLTSTRIVPTKTAPQQVVGTSGYQSPGQLHLGDINDDDDPDYALRLRQAATSRALFNYVPTAPPAQLRSYQQHQPVAQLSPAQQQQQQQRATKQQASGAATNQGRVMLLNDLLNFQTEV